MNRLFNGFDLGNKRIVFRLFLLAVFFYLRSFCSCFGSQTVSLLFCGLQKFVSLFLCIVYKRFRIHFCGTHNLIITLLSAEERLHARFLFISYGFEFFAQNDNFLAQTFFFFEKSGIVNDYLVEKRFDLFFFVAGLASRKRFCFNISDA